MIILTADRSINYVADAYSRAWQLDCAHNILRHLPQEIRDMIYKELLDLRNPTMNHESNRQNKCVPLESTLHGFNPYHNLLLSVKDYPHYFDKTFMGTDFVTELSQVFHSESRFILQHPGELEGFLSQDRFDTDCQPYKHIRYITVEVSLELLNVKTGNCRSWSSPKFATPLKQHFQAALRGLDRLKRLQKAAPIIRLRIDCRKHDAGPKFAEVLAPLVYELKSKGCIIDIEGRYGHGMPNDQSTATDFNYDIPKKDWDAKIKTNSAFVSFYDRSVCFCLIDAGLGNRR
jgi:hypothetical protein